MLYFYRIDLSGGIGVNKRSVSTGSGFFKFLTTLKLLKNTKITISQKIPFFKVTKK